MFRLKDARRGFVSGNDARRDHDTIARGELRSYKQLPQIWYQIQTKFATNRGPSLAAARAPVHDEGFVLFDIDKAGLDKSFDLHDAVYRTIFTRCGLRFVAVEADSGAMGGSQSQEFMVSTMPART